jgi:ectoine hydroxylase-related dioxygenase (phytanoyl-CoA dioxygenase family)
MPETAQPLASTAASSIGIRRMPTVDECAEMQRDGFVVVRAFFAWQEVRQLLRWTEELVAAPEAPGRHWVYREDSLAEPGRRVIQRIENFCPFHGEFEQLVQHGALPRWTGALLGGPAVLFKDKINFKLPGGGGFKAHQDQQAGWSAYAPLFVTAMVTLDRATIENGCLEIEAGRHRQGLIGEEWKPLDESRLNMVSVPTEPGDVIFFDSYAPHASKPNLTDKPRRVLYVTYNPATAGDHRARYFADKHMAFPPDIEREAGKSYVFRV